MQNSTLPIQFSAPPASTGGSAPQRQNPAPVDGPSFAQTLSRQLQQRQDAAPAKPPAPADGASGRAQLKAPAEQDGSATDATATAAPASTPADSAASTVNGKGGKAGNSDGAGEDGKDSAQASTAGSDGASADASASPVAELIAIVASFNQPAVADPATAAAAAAGSAAATPGAGSDGAGGAAQLAAQAQLLAGSRAPAALPAAGSGAVKAEAGQGLSKLFEHARAGARAPAADGAVPAKVGADGASASTLAADVAAGAASAADAKSPAFAGLVQAHAEAASGRAGERLELPTAREPALAAPLAAPLQQAALALAQTAAPADRLGARVGTPAWDNQLGQKIVWMAAGQDQSATLTLNPPDLGPMQVVLSVSNDQAQVTFSAAQPEVRAALEQALPRLREMMSESGIALGNATVNDGAAGQGQAQQDGQGRGRGARSAAIGAAGGPASAGSAPALQRGRVLGGAGAVDTFA